MIRPVHGFAELLATPFAQGVNALCWPRSLAGDFGEVVQQLGPGDLSAAASAKEEGIVPLEEERLAGLALSAEGRKAVETMLADLRLLRDAGRDPVLNIIYGYPRDEDAGPVATDLSAETLVKAEAPLRSRVFARDVFSWHADSAPVEADTWLCTYHGAASEGLLARDARRKVDDPVTRAELLRLYGGHDDESFREWLTENHYDLHYAPRAGAAPYPFGRHNLWRIACAWPGSPVPPCVHRAPDADGPRLLLIS